MNPELEVIEKKLPKDRFLFTSESVTQGHPDKLCDFISDSVLDACLLQDPDSKVACETVVKSNICMVFGEITTKGTLLYEQIVREAIKYVGYDSLAKGFDYKTATIILALDSQSPEIFEALHLGTKEEEIGAGDQGLMIGYASDETEELMPLTHILASKLCERLNTCRREGILPWLRPDGKSQVTVEYKKNEEGHLTPIRVHTVLISCQHDEAVTQEQLGKDLKEHVIKAVIPEKLLDGDVIYHLNPSGSFTKGGPYADSGLTGRKIIVDTYGGWGGHGGGCFSGKDPTKVDRSAAYGARWVAKSLVANGFCKRVLVEVAYGIGIAHPISLMVNSYGSCIEPYTDHDLQDIVIRNFDLRPGCLIRDLQLRKPIYKKTAAFGHFGRDEFPWEVVKDLSLEKKSANGNGQHMNAENKETFGEI